MKCWKIIFREIAKGQQHLFYISLFEMENWFLNLRIGVVQDLPHKSQLFFPARHTFNQFVYLYWLDQHYVHYYIQISSLPDCTMYDSRLIALHFNWRLRFQNIQCFCNFFWNYPYPKLSYHPLHQEHLQHWFLLQLRGLSPHSHFLMSQTFQKLHETSLLNQQTLKQT